MLSFLQVTKLIPQTAFLLDEVDEILGGQFVHDGLPSLLEFVQPLLGGLELLGWFVDGICLDICLLIYLEFLGEDALLVDVVDLLKLLAGAYLLEEGGLLGHEGHFLCLLEDDLALGYLDGGLGVVESVQVA